MGLHNAQHIPRNDRCRHMLSDVFHPVLCDISKKLKVRIQLPYGLFRLVCSPLGASEEVSTFRLRREDEQARGCVANTFVKSDSLDRYFSEIDAGNTDLEGRSQSSRSRLRGWP